MTPSTLQIAVTGLQGPAVFSEPFELLASELAPRLAGRGHAVTFYGAGVTRPASGEAARPGQLCEVPLPGGVETLGQSLTAHFFGMVQACLGTADVILQVHAGGGLFQRLPRLLGRRTVLHLAGLDGLQRRYGPLTDAFLRRSIRTGLRLAHRVVADAEETRRVYEARFGRTCETVPYGAPCRPAPSDTLLRPLGLTPGGYYLCAAPALGAERLPVIAEELKLGSSSRPLIAAVPSASTALDGAATETLPANGRVDAARTVPADSSLWQALLAHAFAFIHRNPLGRLDPVLLEALGAGACVLAEDDPFSREVLAEGAYGIFWRPGLGGVADGVRRLESDPTLPARFRRLATQRVRERYGWDHVTDEYERVLRAATGRGAATDLP